MGWCAPAPDSMGSVSATDRPYFEFCHVYKAFGEREILEDVSFEVNRGECVCVMGRSGVGKSVMLKLIMGFLRPDAGQILAGGLDVAALSESELTEMHKKITMVFQSGALFDSLTVAENIAFPLRERDAMNEAAIESEVGRIMDMLDLTPERDIYPASLPTGLKRAVAIGRALAAKPEAILYDEPTTMVDPLMSHRIGNLIARVQQQTRLTGVVVTHDTHLARRLASRLVLLSERRVSFFGTVAELDASTDPTVRDFMRPDQMAAL